MRTRNYLGLYHGLLPYAVNQGVNYALMESGGASSPELHSVWHHQVSSPVLGSAVFRPLFEFLFNSLFFLEVLFFRLGPALLGQVAGDLFVQRSGEVIFVRSFFGNFLSRSLYPDLLVKTLPVEQHGHFRIELDFKSLLALVVGEEHESLIIILLQEQRARGGLQVFVHSRQNEEIRMRILGLGIFVHLVEDFEWVET